MRTRKNRKQLFTPTSTAVVEGDLTSYERLLRLIGLTEEADVLIGSRDVSVVRRALASHVGNEPRDVRVDRLLRLTLRLLPQGDQADSQRSNMINAISEIIPKYNQWVRMRLEARHMGASGNFFEDANRLGGSLEYLQTAAHCPSIRYLPLPEPQFEQLRPNRTIGPIDASSCCRWNQLIKTTHLEVRFVLPLKLKVLLLVLLERLFVEPQALAY